MKPRFPISGMNRRLVTDAPGVDNVATPLSRTGIAISGSGRRLGISGMRRPLLETNTTTSTTPDDTNEGVQ